MGERGLPTPDLLGGAGARDRIGPRTGPANALILENRAEDPVIPASLVQQLDEIVGEALRCRPEAGQ